MQRCFGAPVYLEGRMPDGKCSQGRDGNGGVMMKGGAVWIVCSLPAKASGAPERHFLSFFPIRALLRCWKWGRGDATASDPWAPGPRSARPHYLYLQTPWRPHPEAWAKKPRKLYSTS